MTQTERHECADASLPARTKANCGTFADARASGAQGVPHPNPGPAEHPRKGSAGCCATGLRRPAGSEAVGCPLNCEGPRRQPEATTSPLRLPTDGTASPAPQVSPWMSIAETCRYLGFSRTKLRRLKPPSHLAGSTPKFHRDEIDRWLLARGAEP